MNKIEKKEIILFSIHLLENDRCFFQWNIFLNLESRGHIDFSLA